ncbi:ankyrin repeat-containing domain protein [Ochromonadaceae sp. CCMP2298]|nr:ankyrin repeat-containing domain protein [Ochromonadaceae sp. CCMP2298]
MNEEREARFAAQLEEQSERRVLRSLRRHPMDLRQEVLVHKLHLACEWWKYDVACFLIECGADVNGLCNDDARSPLYRVCSTEEADTHVAFVSGVNLAKALLQAGADVNYRHEDGDTPFTMAMLYSHYTIALLLLRYGDARTPITSDRPPPLLQVVHLSAADLAYHNPQIALSLMDEIIKLGGDVNETDSFGPPLFHAIRYNDRPEMLELLLQRGAALPSFHEPYGEFQAVDYTHSRIINLARVENRAHRVEDGVFEKSLCSAVQCLVQGGASINRADAQGVTALHAAYACGHLDVARLLEGAGKTSFNMFLGRLSLLIFINIYFIYLKHT